MSLVLNTVSNRICTLTLNRIEKKNALNTELVNELKNNLKAIKEDQHIRAIILTGNGDAFSAGADLEYIQKIRTFSFEENLADSKSLQELFDLIVNHPLPVIAKIKGHALAGGCGLAAMCDFCFASPNAKFGFTETKIGFVPALVSVYLQGQVPNRKLRQWLLSGEVISAQEAKGNNLINEVCELAEIDEYVQKFTEKLIAQNSGNSIALTKKLLIDIIGKEQQVALQIAAETNAKARASNDCIKGVDSFLNKEPIEW